MVKHNFNMAARIQSNRHDVYAKLAATNKSGSEMIKPREVPKELATMMQITGYLATKNQVQRSQERTSPHIRNTQKSSFGFYDLEFHSGQKGETSKRQMAGHKAEIQPSASPKLKMLQSKCKDSPKKINTSLLLASKAACVENRRTSSPACQASFALDNAATFKETHANKNRNRTDKNYKTLQQRGNYL